MTEEAAKGCLIEFSFVSSLDPSMPLAVVARLARQIWRRNTEAGLTGTMALSGREVRQVIEGELEPVLALASRIISDPRHAGIRVLSFGPLEARRHAGWNVTGLDGEAGAAAVEVQGTILAFQHTDAPLRLAAAR